MKKIHFQKVIDDLNLMEILKWYQVTVVGTPPLGIATAQSDIDLICSYPIEQENHLIEILKLFQTYKAWCIERSYFERDTWICRFEYYAWSMEIFCSTTPIHQQAGFQHFYVERRILDLANDQFKQEIIRLKRKGIKTEPAFAQMLALDGDPYTKLSQLYEADDCVLIQLLQCQGYLD